MVAACVALAFAVIAVTGCGSTSSSSTSTTSSTNSGATTTTTADTHFATFGDGTYTIGGKVKPGTYRAPHPSSLCYWARLSGFGGSANDIIANENTSAPAVVTIAPTDKGFKTSGCGNWTADLSQITSSKTSIPAGTYIVNTDIQPGTYQAPGGDGCYWARLSGFGGSTDSLIANDNPTGNTVVTVAPSDKGFQSHGCGTFTLSSASAQATTSATGSTTPQSPTGTTQSGSGGSLTACDQNISVNSVTSCPFADNVFKAYVQSYKANGAQASTVVSAYSPVTKKPYTMTCTSDGNTVNCAGGINSFVTFPISAVQAY
jgi:hypothetical protein